MPRLANLFLLLKTEQLLTLTSQPMTEGVLCHTRLGEVSWYV